jgi:hypothetical protein
MVSGATMTVEGNKYKTQTFGNAVNIESDFAIDWPSGKGVVDFAGTVSDGYAVGGDPQYDITVTNGGGQSEAKFSGVNDFQDLNANGLVQISSLPRGNVNVGATGEICFNFGFDGSASPNRVVLMDGASVNVEEGKTVTADPNWTQVLSQVMGRKGSLIGTATLKVGDDGVIGSGTFGPDIDFQLVTAAGGSQAVTINANGNNGDITIPGNITSADPNKGFDATIEGGKIVTFGGDNEFASISIGNDTTLVLTHVNALGGGNTTVNSTGALRPEVIGAGLDNVTVADGGQLSVTIDGLDLTKPTWQGGAVLKIVNENLTDANTDFPALAIPVILVENNGVSEETDLSVSDGGELRSGHSNDRNHAGDLTVHAGAPANVTYTLNSTDGDNNNYTGGLQITGQIDENGKVLSLVKTGKGVIGLDNANNVISGSVSIYGGGLNIGAGGALGQASVTSITIDPNTRDVEDDELEDTGLPRLISDGDDYLPDNVTIDLVEGVWSIFNNLGTNKQTDDDDDVTGILGVISQDGNDATVTGVLDLNYEGIDVVGAFLIDGVDQGLGRFGHSSASPSVLLANNDQYFAEGTGLIEVVPEPASAILVGLGGVLIAIRRRRRQRF